MMVKISSSDVLKIYDPCIQFVDGQYGAQLAHTLS